MSSRLTFPFLSSPIILSYTCFPSFLPSSFPPNDTSLLSSLLPVPLPLFYLLPSSILFNPSHFIVFSSFFLRFSNQSHTLLWSIFLIASMSLSPSLITPIYKCPSYPLASLFHSYSLPTYLPLALSTYHPPSDPPAYQESEWGGVPFHPLA